MTGSALPDRWKETSFGEACDMLTGFPFPSAGFSEQGVRLLRGSNVKRGEVDWSDAITVFWPKVDGEIAKYSLRAGDLVIAMDGALVGRSFAALSEADVPSLLVQRVARLRGRSVVQSLLGQLVASQSFLDHVDSVKTHTAIPHISPVDIRQFAFRIPLDEAEQRAIAAALSDVDALLAKIDQLIAKKRDLKQAAMQKLLTGRRRLPGFAGQWTRRTFGTVLTICHGKSQRDVESPDGPFPILATGGQIGTASAWIYDKPSVLIGRKGTIDRPQYMEAPFWTVDTLFYSAMKGAHCAKFFYYRFCLIDWSKYNEASGVPSLNARTIEAIEVDCPDPLEQIAIAEVLSDMDAELAALEARREKTRQLKQGMMQALLTGRIRLT